MNDRIRLRAGQVGLSLVELMVAVTISLILLAGIIQLLASNKANYEINDDLARLQEHGRFAVDFMLRDLRMSRYFGCHDNMDNVTSDVAVTTTGQLWDMAFPLEGFDQDAGITQTWFPSGFATRPAGSGAAANPTNGCPGVYGGACPGSDLITIRYADGSRGQALTADPAGASADLQIATGNGLVQGQIAAVSDCTSADVFAVNSANPDTTGTIGHANAFSKVYDSDESARVAPVVLVRYYVGTGSPRVTTTGAAPVSGPSLFRQVVDPSGASISETCAGCYQELVPGVENMQILYGVDTDNDGLANRYLRAGETAGGINLTGAAGNSWANVVSVRIGLRVRTEDEYGADVDAVVRPLNGAAVGAANDRRRRRDFITTVQLRNRVQS